MSEFSKLKAELSQLEAISISTLGSNELVPISLEEPAPPLDELYFRKVVAWCYALHFETGTFLKFSRDLVRGLDPDGFRQINESRDIVRCARTVHAHNLRNDRDADVQVRSRYRNWLLVNGGYPVDWERSISAIVGIVLASLRSMERAWSSSECGKSSGKQIASWYFLDKQTYWEAHEFDRCVESAAAAIGLSGLDHVRFRDSDGRLDRWRKLVGFFNTREDAREAVERAIRRELTGLFGDRSE